MRKTHRPDRDPEPMERRFAVGLVFDEWKYSRARGSGCAAGRLRPAGLRLHEFADLWHRQNRDRAAYQRSYRHVFAEAEADRRRIQAAPRTGEAGCPDDRAAAAAGKYRHRIDRRLARIARAAACAHSRRRHREQGQAGLRARSHQRHQCGEFGQHAGIGFQPVRLGHRRRRQTPRNMPKSSSANLPSPSKAARRCAGR